MREYLKAETKLTNIIQVAWNDDKIIMERKEDVSDDNINLLSATTFQDEIKGWIGLNAQSNITIVSIPHGTEGKMIISNLSWDKDKKYDFKLLLKEQTIIINLSHTIWC